MFLVLALSAQAHVPHDMVGFFAAPADLSAAHPWWLGGFLGGRTELFVSTNKGISWTKSNVAAGNYYIDDLTYMDDGTLVAASWWQLLYSRDDGATWTAVEAPGVVADLAGSDRLWIATDEGLFETTDPAVEATLALQGPFTDVEAIGKDASAVTADGTPFVFTDGVWEDAPPPAGQHATAIAADGSYMGTFDGHMYSWGDNGWQECGPLLGTGSPHSLVLHIAQDGDGNVVVLTGLGGPYVGEDGCAGWLDHTVPLAPAYGMMGGVHDQEDAYTVLMTVGRNYVVAGWAGIYLSKNYGVDWREAQWFLTTPLVLLKPEGPGGDGIDRSVDDPGASIPASDPDEGEAGSRGCLGAAVQALVIFPVVAGLRRRRRS